MCQGGNLADVVMPKNTEDVILKLFVETTR